MIAFRFILILFLLTMSTSIGFASTSDETSASEVARGLAFLDEGDRMSEADADSALLQYRQAAAILENVRQKYNLHNAQLNHAIGNAYFKSGELGHAILAYRRALTLDPTNRAARDSLEYARSVVGNQIPASRSHRIEKWLVSWRGYIPRLTLWYGAVAAFLIGWVFVSIRIRYRVRVLMPVCLVAFGFSVVAFAALGFDAWETRSQTIGVVTDSSIIARTGPSIRIYGDAFQSPLTAGTEFILVDERDGWIQIQLASNALGWIPEDSAAFVGLGVGDHD